MPTKHCYQHTIIHHTDDTAFNAGNKQQVQQYIFQKEFNRPKCQHLLLNAIHWGGGPKKNRTGFRERFLIVVECSPAR